jgi:hypothetical protein
MPSHNDMVQSRPTRSGLVLALSAIALVAAFSFASPAQAQTPPTTCLPDDPYGCLATTTTLAPAQIPTPGCQVPSAAVRVGETVSPTITNVPEGLTINLQLAGQTVATATAAASASGYADVPMSFVVPQLAAGNYPLVATGPGFTSECLPGTGLEVLGGQIARGTTGEGGGSLARTGFTIAGFLLAGALLIVGGRYLVERSRHDAYP